MTRAAVGPRGLWGLVKTLIRSSGGDGTSPQQADQLSRLKLKKKKNR